MAISPEMKQKLDDLLAAKILSQAEYDAKVNPTEGFNLSKFLHGMFGTANGVNWAKDIHSIFNIRKIIIYVLIGAACYFFALKQRIPTFDLQGKEYTIALDQNENLHFTKSGIMQITDKNGKVIKTIRAKDIPQVNQVLHPIGFQLKPIAVVGMGGGAKGDFGFEGGVGVSTFHFYKLNVDHFITNKGIYPLGLSYRLEKVGSGNTSVGIAGGMGWKGDPRVMGYVRLEF